LSMADALRKTAALVDQRGGQLRRVHGVPAHLGEVGRSAVEDLICQLLQVVDATHRDQRVGAQMRTDDQRLVVVIADHADPDRSAHASQVVLEFAAELRVRNVFDQPGNALSIAHRHPTSNCAQVRMVIRAVEQIGHAVVLCSNSAETSHRDNSSFR
jgi:hypothetical protein